MYLLRIEAPCINIKYMFAYLIVLEKAINKKVFQKSHYMLSQCLYVFRSFDSQLTCPNSLFDQTRYVVNRTHSIHNSREKCLTGKEVHLVTAITPIL